MDDHHYALSAALLVHAALLPATARAQQDAPARDSIARRVDRVFARFNADTSPGCALGVAQGGRTVFERGYGMANLEHRVPITPATVFETGSVAKQFTAASVVLLAQQGKLSLDDPVRRHIPELPEYERPVTLRQMLHHTSGLRDWLTLFSVAGRPAGDHVYANADVLALAARQRTLNFAPGSEYLYSNTGYTLLAEVVRRVSGEPFAAFGARHIFGPLGMTHTRWRDDFRRVEPGRATAYAPGDSAGTFRADMPFMNAHGSGGLLTTVGDLLRWAENFVHPTVGGRALVDTLQTTGRLTSGRPIDYALGMRVTTYKGVPEVSHSGATAGYRTFLVRFPKQHLATAVLCNVASANTPALAHAVADVFLAGHLTEPAAQRTAGGAGGAGTRLSDAALAARAGLYFDERTGETLRVTAANGALRAEQPAGSFALTPLSPVRFRVGSGAAELLFDRGAARLAANGDTTRYARVTPAAPAGLQLADYAGTYTSDELEARFVVALRGQQLVMRPPAGAERLLSPITADAFTLTNADGGPAGTIRFARDPRGWVTGFDVFAGRARGVRFTRQAR